MKKKIIFVFLLLIFSSFIILYKLNVDGATKNDNSMNKYGYRITVMYYDGTGKKEQVGKPILVYQKGLLETIVGDSNKGNYPKTHDALKNKKYPITQFVHKGKDYKSVKRNKGEGELLKGISEGKNNKEQAYDADVQKAFDKGEGVTITWEDYWGNLNYQGRIQYLMDTDQAKNYSEARDLLLRGNFEQGDMVVQDGDELAEQLKDDDNIYYEFEGGGACEYISINQPSESEIDPGYDTYTLRYMTNAYIVTYPGSMVILDEYYKTYEDSGTPKEMAIKYAGSIDLIKNNFNIKLDSMKIKNYYIQVEVVERVFETDSSKQNTIGSYIAYRITTTTKEKKEWNSGTGSWYSYRLCPAGYRGTAYFGGSPTSCFKCDACPSDKYCDSNCENVYFKSGYAPAYCDEGYTKTITSESSNGMFLNWYCKKKYGNPSTVVPTQHWVAMPCSPGEREIDYFYGSIRVAPSYLIASKDINGQFVSKARNSCQDTDNIHPILDENDKPTGKNLYYTGSNLEVALVGPRTTDPNNKALKNKKYPYVLNDAIWNGKEYVCTKKGDKDYKAPEQGTQIFAFIDLPDPSECEKACKKLGKKNSPEFLNCAEQYAEGLIDYDTKGNNRKRKLNIIINSCKYTYGVSPTNGSTTKKDRESENSCNNSATELFKGPTYQYNKLSKSSNTNSSCNMVDGIFASDIRGSRVSRCIGDKVTDFDGNDRNEIPTAFDQRSYVNKVCLDTTDFEFKDTSQLDLSKGGGFTYPVKQEGEKICTYFFNLEQWTVDYASAPARDPEQRKRLDYIIEAFNAEATGKSTTKSKNYLAIFDGEDYGRTLFEKEKYDFSETTVSTTIKENLTTNKTNTNTNSSMKIDKNANNTVRLQAIGQETTIRVANGKIDPSVVVNRYISVSEDKVTRNLDKVCISTDGLATVYDSPGNDVCFSQGKDGKTTDIQAEKKYYTSFQIDDTKSNNISANVVVGKDSNIYYKNTEKCTYKINDSYSCTLEIENTNGLEKLGDRQYLADSLNVGIHYKIDNSLINSVSIIDNNTTKTVSSGTSSINIANRANRSVEMHDLVGKVTLKDGKTATCKLTVELISKKSAVGCKITQVEGNDKLYKITSTGAGVEKYYTYLSGHMTPKHSEIISSGTKPYSYMREVTLSVGQEERYIRLNKPLEEGEILYGYVTTSNNAVNGSCYIYGKAIANKNEIDCTKTFKPMDTQEVKEYCTKNWKEDINGYTDSDDCFARCTMVCPNNCSNEQEVSKYCQKAKSLGFPGDDAELLCKNECYCGSSNDSNDYLFRSVNVLNPFPNSQESNEPYEKGNRIVGKNWRYLSDYISNDSKDATSVTGDNANKGVEYVIDITAADIRNIRNDTKTSDLNISKNKKKVYAQLDRLKTNNSKIISEFKSQFINSKYSGLFRQAHGNTPASFVPGSN